MGIPEFDKLRFQYEYGGGNIEALCAEHGYLISELTDYITKANWEIQSTPDLENKEQVDTYYSLARRRLTVEMSRQALVSWSRITQLEFDLLAKTQEAIELIDTSLVGGQPGLELSRLAKVVSSVKASNQIFLEAISAPAMKDKDIEELLKTPEGTRWVVEVVHKALEAAPIDETNCITYETAEKDEA